MRWSKPVSASAFSASSRSSGSCRRGCTPNPDGRCRFASNRRRWALHRAAALAILTTLAAIFVVVGVATAAAGRYRAMTAALGGFAICAALGALVARPAIEPAYPTSFYAPAEPYAAASIEARRPSLCRELRALPRRRRQRRRPRRCSTYRPPRRFDRSRISLRIPRAICSGGSATARPTASCPVSRA